MARLQFKQGLANALGLDVSACEIVSVDNNTPTTSQPDTVTTTYTVESETDLISVLQGEDFGSILAAEINAAGSTIPPISIADFVTEVRGPLSPFPTLPIRCYATGSGTQAAMAGRQESLAYRWSTNFL